MKSLFSEVATTRGITVRVSVSYLPEQSEPDRGRWFWAYHIRIENEGDQAVQLLTRHWIITDAEDKVQEVRGEGVIGQQPVLQPGERFSYTSGCPLMTPDGSMSGSYARLGDDGTTLAVAVPLFPLDSPYVKKVLH